MQNTVTIANVKSHNTVSILRAGLAPRAISNVAPLNTVAILSAVPAVPVQAPHSTLAISNVAPLNTVAVINDVTLNNVIKGT